MPKSHDVPLLLVDHTARWIPDSLIELLDLVCGCAKVFDKSLPRINRLYILLGYEMKFFRLAHPGFRIGLRIRQRHGKFNRVVVNTLVAFLKMHLIAVRISKMVHPCSWVN